MSIAADAIRNLITPLLSSWRVQFGRWIDGAPTDRFAVIRPAGGVPSGAGILGQRNADTSRRVDRG